MIPNPARTLARLMEVNATPLPGEGGWGKPPPSIPTPVSSTQRKYHFAFTSGNGGRRIDKIYAFMGINVTSDFGIILTLRKGTLPDQ